ncbi:MAG: SpoIVB peptidase [Oscillospiraceae bacterium]|nr:SpoIVB peptidase [Oscillospiraceae bacterium]
MKIKQNCVKLWISRIAVCGAALLTALTGAVEYYAHNLPDHYYLQADHPLTVSTVLPVTVSRGAPAAADLQEAELRLFGVVPVKTVSLTTVSPVSVYVGGEPFGIRMLMDGVMVVSMSEISTQQGTVCPAERAGIRVGDIIQAVNGVPVRGNAELQQAVSEADGSAVSITLLRGSLQRTVSVQPVYSPAAKRWQTGMWVRDSTAGIGTVTYYYQAPGGQIQFAGLGHAVCDADTGEQIPLASGDVIAVSVRDVISGAAGAPGELRGRFDPDAAIGMLQSNHAAGVFGTMNGLPQKQILMPLGFRQDVKTGAAQIYTTIDGTEPRAYSVEIEEIRGNDAAMRNLIVHVTDPVLLQKTGGIVQGMSGSPIIQDGRLIGAVTHVFVRDPTRGYGIFAENMYAQTASQAVSAAYAAGARAAGSMLPAGR